MVDRKYTGDYRLENEERRGKLRTVAVYRGTWYRFADPAAARRAGGILIAVLGAALAAFAGGLLLNTALMRRLYVSLPFVCALVPLGYLGVALWYVRRAGERFTRERRDKTAGRIRHCAVCLTVFGGVPLIAGAVLLSCGAVSPGWQEWLVLLCSAVLLAAGVTALCLRRAFDAVEAGPDGETPPENPAEQT